MHGGRILRACLAMVAVQLAMMAGAAAGISLEPVAASVDVLPRQAVTLAAHVRNHVHEPVDLTFVSELPPGWTELVPPGNVSVGPGADRLILVTVLAPAAAAAGEYRIGLVASVHGDVLGRAQFDVSVPRIDRMRLERLEGPEHATGEAYRTTFLLQNEGNAHSIWRVEARSSEGLTLDLERDQVSLGPGESVRIDIVATIPRELKTSTPHKITMSAAPASGDADPATATSTTMLIPSTTSGGPSIHTFPLTVQLGSGIRLDRGVSLAGPWVAVVGRGRLTDRDAGTLEIDLEGGLRDPIGSGELLLAYRTGWGVAKVGHQAFARSEFLGTVSGFGAAYTVSWDAEDLEVTLDGHGYLNGAGGGAGAGMAVASTTGIRLSGRAHADASGLVGTVSVGYRNLSAAPAAVRLGELGATYAIRTDSAGWGAGHAFEIEGDVHGGPLRLEASYRVDTGAFTRTFVHASELDVRASLEIPANLASTGMPAIDLVFHHADVRAWPSASPASGAGEAPAGRDDTVDLTFGVAASALFGDAEVSVGHEESSSNERDSVAWSSRTWLRATLPLGDQIRTGHEATWIRASGIAEHVVRSQGSVRWATPGGGRLEAGYSLDLGMSTVALHEFGVQAAWWGPIGPSVALGAEVDLDLMGRGEWLEVGVDVEGRLPNGHSVRFEGQGGMREDRPPRAHLDVTYTVPFQIPLGPRSDVGTVRGNVRTADGQPLVGVVVSAAGRLGVTDAEGTYLLGNVPTGDHSVHLLTDTLQVADPVVAPRSSPEVRVVAAAVTTQDFVVSPGATISGRIVPVDSGPMSPLGVVVPGGGPGRWMEGALVRAASGDTVLRGVTDARGTFRLPGLPAGRWTVTVERPGLPSDWTLEGSEHTFELAAGEEKDVVVKLAPVRRTIRFQDGGSVDARE